MSGGAAFRPRRPINDQEPQPMLRRISPRPGSAAWAAFGLWAVSLALVYPRTGQAQVSPEESARKLKPAEGQRVSVRPGDVEDRKPSEVSLRPAGLAQTMSDQDLVDLLAFLSSLRQPVSIVGQYQVICPIAEPNGTLALDPTAGINLAANLRGPEGQKFSWRRLDTNAEGLANLTTLAGAGASRAVYVYAPVVSAIDRETSLVVDSQAELKVWLGGRSVALHKPSEDASRVVTMTLPRGTSDLLICVAGGSTPHW
jgi:hypothetical protein